MEPLSVCSLVVRRFSNQEVDCGKGMLSIKKESRAMRWTQSHTGRKVKTGMKMLVFCSLSISKDPEKEIEGLEEKLNNLERCQHKVTQKRQWWKHLLPSPPCPIPRANVSITALLRGLASGCCPSTDTHSGPCVRPVLATWLLYGGSPDAAQSDNHLSPFPTPTHF